MSVIWMNLYSWRLCVRLAAVDAMVHADRAPKLDANVACTLLEVGILGGSANASFSAIKPSRAPSRQGDDTAEGR